MDNPLELMPGKKINNSEDFNSFIMDVYKGKDDYKLERKKVQEKLHKYVDNKSSRRILKKVGII